jgi:hypothetical protein
VASPTSAPFEAFQRSTAFGTHDSSAFFGLRRHAGAATPAVHGVGHVDSLGLFGFLEVAATGALFVSFPGDAY